MGWEAGDLDSDCLEILEKELFSFASSLCQPYTFEQEKSFLHTHHTISEYGEPRQTGPLSVH